MKKILTKLRLLKLSITRTYKFIKHLLLNDNMTKTNVDSHSIYQGYNDREQVAYETASSRMLYNNILVNMTYKEARFIYLENIFFEIDDLLTKQARVKILEIGCGNCINIYNIKKKYGEKVELVGLDISDKRIKVAKRYFSPFLDDIEFLVSSIVKKTNFTDNEFDIVFSMHCLEQISYEAKQAVQEMYRLTKFNLLMIEPVFENGSYLQKLYLIDSDHNRILLKVIKELNLKIIKNEILKIQSNPSNQSTFLKIVKVQGE